MAVTTTDRFGRTRDQQKERVYRAEDSIRTLRSPKAARMLDTEARLIPQRGVGCLPGGKSPSIEDCQRYVDDVLRDPWVQRRWGQQTVTVHWKASGSATCSYGGTIALPPWSRIESVILHELAHHLNGQSDTGPGKCAHHGPEFAGVLLALVRHRMGAEAGKRLRAAMREKRARVSMAHVPAPTRPVVTAADRAAKAALREQRLVATTSPRLRAAEVIRRLSKRPVPLWAVGSKPRTYALATARALVDGHTARPFPPVPTNLREQDIVEAVAVIRACVKADVLGKAGSKPRARALAVARTLEKEAPKYAPDGRRMVYAAKPAAW